MTLIGAMFLALFIPGLLTIALIVAVALPRAIRDEQRKATNHCIECGYDLRDSPGLCPECGHEPVREGCNPPPGQFPYDEVGDHVG